MSGNMDLVRRFIEQVQIGGDTALCDELVSADFVNHQILARRPEPVGREEFCAGFAVMARAFTDFNVEILDMVEAGDKVWTYKRLSGTHSGDFHGIAPTGNQIRVSVMDILRIRDGQIVEHWAVSDQFAMAKQLGVM